MLRHTVVVALTILVVIFGFLVGQATVRVDYAKTVTQHDRAVGEVNAAALLLIVFGGLWIIAYFGFPA